MNRLEARAGRRWAWGSLPLLAWTVLATALAAPPDAKRVLFLYDNPAAASVALAGEFSRGQPIPMSRREDGVWSCWATIPPGVHAYKFLVDGKHWEFDPKNSARKRLRGVEYSAVTVGNQQRPPSGAAAAPAAIAPAAAVEPSLKLDVKVEERRNTSRLNHSQTHEQMVELEVTVHNRELNREFTGLTIDLYVVARDATTSRDYKLVLRETKTFDLPLGREYQFQLEPVRLAYDDVAPYKYGFKFHGHVYVLTDQAGRVLKSEGIPAKLCEKLATFKDLPLGQSFQL